MDQIFNGSKVRDVVHELFNAGARFADNLALGANKAC